MNDSTPMPFGKHKGKMMICVPGKYLLMLNKKGYAKGALKTYIENNTPVLGKKDRQ